MSYEPWIHAAFTSHVRRNPGTQAVSSESGDLTYAELDGHADHLARLLVEAGAGSDDVVLVQTGHTLSLPIGVLAAVKANAAFCVIDPAIPDDRQRLMRAESGARFIVADHTLASALAGAIAEDPAPARLIAIDPNGVVAAPGLPPVPDRNPDDLAYVVFTSGSTGVPKAIGMPNRCLDNLIPWTLDSTSDEPLRTLQFSALGFDVFVQEVFATWCSGGCLHLPTAANRHDLMRVHELLRQQCIERIFLPPLALVRLAEIACAAGEFPTSLRQVAVAGEALRITARLREFFTRLPGCALHNHYGPAETHVVTAFSLCGPAENWPDLPPIGSAIPATVLRVRDRDGHPVSGTTVGELHVGGAGVARGYLNGPIGAGRFQKDVAGIRWYTTGDLVRDTGSGVLEFCGRTDDQVKIRGYRVEPGEVETVLNAHPGVRECVVVPVTQTGRGTTLAAYAVLVAETTPSELRSFLASRLPDYLVPGHLAILDRLPVSINGKVDRARLPSPVLDVDYEESPIGDTELAIAAIWDEVLSRTGTGRRTGFLELGGDSLSAAMVLSRVRARFGTTVRLQDFFAEPTVAELASRVAIASPDAALAPTPGQADRPQRYRPAPAQERMWFLTRLGLGNRAYSITVALDLPMPGTPTQAASLAATVLTEIYARHPVLRSQFAPDRDGLWASIAPPVPVTVSLHDLRTVSAGEAPAAIATLERLTADEAIATDSAPLLRARLLVLAQAARLIVTVHHLIFDGASIDVFAREVSARWRGEDPIEGEPKHDFDAYAAREHASDAGPARLHRVEEWGTLLDGIGTTLRLPHPGERPKVQSFRGSRVAAPLDTGVVQRLRALAAEQHTSVYAVLLALFGGYLSRLAGGVDVIVGMPVAGRDEVSSEQAIGYFVRTVPVPIRCADDPTVEAAARRAWSSSLAARDLADVPLEAVVRSLAPTRDLSRPPLMQALLAYRTVPVGVDGQPLPLRVVASESAKFDLTLEVVSSLDEMSLELEFSSDLWDRPSAEVMHSALVKGIITAVAEPRSRLSNIFGQ